MHKKLIETTIDSIGTFVVGKNTKENENKMLLLHDL